MAKRPGRHRLRSQCPPGTGFFESKSMAEGPGSDVRHFAIATFDFGLSFRRFGLAGLLLRFELLHLRLQA